MIADRGLLSCAALTTAQRNNKPQPKAVTILIRFILANLLDTSSTVGRVQSTTITLHEKVNTFPSNPSVETERRSKEDRLKTPKNSLPTPR